MTERTGQVTFDRPRPTEARASQPNPPGTLAPLEALRTVILYTLSDAFALCPEEVTWAGYHLDRIVAPLLDQMPQNVPLAVRQEMLEGTYSASMARNEARPPVGTVWDQRATHASVNDWASVTLQMLGECYALTPMAESAMHAQIATLLRDLGVDHPTKPRPATYLPSDLRHRLGGAH